MTTIENKTPLEIFQTFLDFREYKTGYLKFIDLNDDEIFQSELYAEFDAWCFDLKVPRKYYNKTKFKLTLVLHHKEWLKEHKDELKNYETQRKKTIVELLYIDWLDNVNYGECEPIIQAEPNKIYSSSNLYKHFENGCTVGNIKIISNIKFSRDLNNYLSGQFNKCRKGGLRCFKFISKM